MSDVITTTVSNADRWLKLAQTWRGLFAVPIVQWRQVVFQNILFNHLVVELYAFNFGAPQSTSDLVIVTNIAPLTYRLHRWLPA